MARARMLQSLRWELSSESIPDEIAVCLSQQEKRFKDDYNEVLREYMSDMDIDLTLVRAIHLLKPLPEPILTLFHSSKKNLHEPPTKIDIEVLVLQDFGSIATEEGSITLKKNTTTVMRRTIAEPLIKMGILQHITDAS